MWWEFRHNSTNLNHCGDTDRDDQGGSHRDSRVYDDQRGSHRDSRVHDDHRGPHRDSRVHDDHRRPHHNYGTAANDCCDNYDYTAASDLRCVYDNDDREHQLDLRTACPSCGQ